MLKNETAAQAGTRDGGKSQNVSTAPQYHSRVPMSTGALIFRALRTEGGAIYGLERLDRHSVAGGAR